LINIKNASRQCATVSAHHYDHIRRKTMHTADLPEDKATGRRIGITVAVLLVVMVGLIIVSNIIS
jgi:hypothetical protein